MNFGDIETLDIIISQLRHTTLYNVDTEVRMLHREKP